MKTKVLLLMVLLIGITCLVVYGRRRAPTYDEQRRTQKQLYDQQQAELNQLQRQRQDRAAERRRRQEVSAPRLAAASLVALEARITALEHALTTQVSYEGIPGMPEVPSDLRAVINAETIRQSKEGKAAIHAIARDRIIKAVKFQAGKKLK